MHKIFAFCGCEVSICHFFYHSLSDIFSGLYLDFCMHLKEVSKSKCLISTACTLQQKHARQKKKTAGN